MDGYIMLVMASAAFVGTHFLMSHPLRAPMVSKLNAGGFMGVYSLVSAVTMGWMIWAFVYSPSGDLFWLPNDGIWVASSLLTLLAAIFYCGSMIGNPAMANPDEKTGSALANKIPTGMFLVTRHPMMWSFALWGIAHILVAPRIDSFIFVGSIIFLALAGAKMQEAKKADQFGTDWAHWQAQTSYMPRLSQLPKIGYRLWLAGILIWLIATWAHNFFGNYNAGIYRWIGA